MKPDCSLPLVVWKVGIPGNATDGWLVWGHWGEATRCSLLLTADISESPMKCDMTAEHEERSEMELNFSTKDFKNFYHREKFFLNYGERRTLLTCVNYLSQYNYFRAFITSQMLWVRNSGAG